MPTGWITLRNVVSPHSGHTVRESSVNDWRMSKAWPQPVHA